MHFEELLLEFDQLYFSKFYYSEYLSPTVFFIRLTFFHMNINVIGVQFIKINHKKSFKKKKNRGKEGHSGIRRDKGRPQEMERPKPPIKAKTAMPVAFKRIRPNRLIFDFIFSFLNEIPAV